MIRLRNNNIIARILGSILIVELAILAPDIIVWAVVALIVGVIWFGNSEFTIERDIDQ